MSKSEPQKRRKEIKLRLPGPTRFPDYMRDEVEECEENPEHRHWVGRATCPTCEGKETSEVSYDDTNEGTWREQGQRSWEKQQKEKKGA